MTITMNDFENRLF